MVQILRKAALPVPVDVPEHLRPAAAQALAMMLREPRPEGFPLLFTSDLQLIEPAVAFLHEHSIQRAHTVDTLRSYVEILYDWFETLEQNGIDWTEADAVDLVAYRNRMLQQPSEHTGRPYRISTQMSGSFPELSGGKSTCQPWARNNSPTKLSACSPRRLGGEGGGM
jgi:hypothetical protein